MYHKTLFVTYGLSLKFPFCEMVVLQMLAFSRIEQEFAKIA